MSVDVMDIVKTYLKERGFDGLFNSGECACTIEGGLAPCGNFENECEPGYKVPCNCDGEHEYDVQKTKLMNHPSQDLGRTLRSYREASGLSPNECAERVNVTPAAWAHWESGRRGISLPHLNQIRVLFNLKLEDLYIMIVAAGRGGDDD